MSQKSDLLSMLTAAAIGIASLGEAHELAATLRARVAAPAPAAAAVADCAAAVTPLAARAPT